MERMFKATEKVFVNKNTGKMYGNMGVESAMVVEEFNPLLRSFFNNFFKAIKKLYREKYDEKVAEELAERSWICTSDFKDKMLLIEDPASLWKNCMLQQGPDLALFAHFPVNVADN
jgi:hypothetical protein